MSPIMGLTNRGCSFAQIGMIRKGAKTKNAQGKEHPIDLKHFRVEFDSQEKVRAEKFVKLYGDKPTEINIFLPFDEIDRVWDAWCEAYTAGRMVARSDGENFLYLVDHNTGAVLVRDGVDANGAKVPHKEVLGKSSTGKTIIKCLPVGRLKVLIPELQSLVYLVLTTSSVIDIRNISQQLEGIRLINNGHLVGIPLILRRRPKMISVPNPDGSKRRLEKWMVSIEADPTWVSKKLAQLSMAAVPALPAGIMQGLAAGEHQDEPMEEETPGEWTELDEDETDDPGEPEEDQNWEPAEEEQPKPVTPAIPVKLNGAPRPYDPQTLRNKLSDLAATKSSAHCSDKQRSLAFLMLDKIFQSDDKRHEFLNYMGFKSFKDVPGNVVLAYLDWLKPASDSGGDYTPDAMATKEAMAAYEFSLRSKGQQDLFTQAGA